MMRTNDTLKATFSGICLVFETLIASSACHSQVQDPVPPAARFELAIAPPGARGARAAGTDAAPQLTAEPNPAEVEEFGGSDDELDGGSLIDAGPPPAPDSDGGVAL